VKVSLVVRRRPGMTGWWLDLSTNVRGCPLLSGRNECKLLVRLSLPTEFFQLLLVDILGARQGALMFQYPMSSPQMTRMLGLSCVQVGVAAESDSSAAPSTAVSLALDSLNGVLPLSSSIQLLMFYLSRHSEARLRLNRLAQRVHRDVETRTGR